VRSIPAVRHAVVLVEPGTCDVEVSPAIVVARLAVDGVRICFPTRAVTAAPTTADALLDAAVAPSSWVAVEVPASGTTRTVELAVHAVLTLCDRQRCDGVVLANQGGVEEAAVLANAVVSADAGPTAVALWAGSGVLQRGEHSARAVHDRLTRPVAVASEGVEWLAQVECARRITGLEGFDPAHCPGDLVIGEVAAGRRPPGAALRRALVTHHALVMHERLGCGARGRDAV